MKYQKVYDLWKVLDNLFNPVFYFAIVNPYFSYKDRDENKSPITPLLLQI